ncbi:hypothetical protein ONZ43_g5902 [Nemania bipapillata]|uniref:Uncharacterized protein n=1 Tax=Nemania bipapillata TaxID=110536 RepID=A0ACC2I4X4_9PEZI|nr:hypothetical protein ONZ43_g5902 [Nemania bipapillata]
MDRSLDEIVAESQAKKRGHRAQRGGGGSGGGSGGSGGRQPRQRDSYPRDGPETNLVIPINGVLMVQPQSDLEGLFNKIGPVVKLELLYDRAGRSEGVAFVTYESRDDALDAIREFNGANAKGQPIHMTIVSSAPRRNPFDTAQMPGRPLSERITRPRSLSPNDRGIDRYVPEGGRRSHSPKPRRRGRRVGTRRENGGETAARPTGRDGRPKKTQEELDAEMEDYFEKSNKNTAVATNEGQTTAQATDDVDMIE